MIPPKNYAYLVGHVFCYEQCANVWLSSQSHKRQLEILEEGCVECIICPPDRAALATYMVREVHGDEESIMRPICSKKCEVKMREGQGSLFFFFFFIIVNVLVF